jgi:N-methylhydantoinase B
VNEPARVDPITLATVWHGFQTVCREMRHMMERTAQSFLMSQLRDLSVGLWKADGSTVAMPEGLLDQFLGTRFAIEHIREKFGDELRPGDVILTNDPYHGGHAPHLPDWGFIRPIFDEDRLLFFTLVRGHVMDTGGSFPGGYFPDGYDIHAEGLCIPPTKVIEAGVERTDVLELIFNNVRFREEMEVDCQAMIATTAFAERRVGEIVGRYGAATVLASVDEMIERTERAVRAEIRAMPDGTYHGESATDDDGTVLDEPVWVRVAATIDGDELTLDFSDSDSQRPGFVNRVWAATYGTAVGSAILLMDPALADFHNEGSLRPITVVAPRGSVLNCEYPATVGGSPVSVGEQITEAVTEAISKARPERALAAWGKHRGDYTSGADPRSGRPYVRTSFDYDGSAGAVAGYDGATGPTSFGTLGSVQRGNVEEAEVRFPWKVLRLEVVPDFMGAGRWRGGGGVDWRALNEGGRGRMATGSSDGDEMVPKGVLGGRSSPVSRTFVQRDGELIRVKPHRMQDLRAGDVVVKLSSGGAGVGDPYERDPESVRRDVVDEMVTLEAARRIYGVALDPETLELDREATEALRASGAPREEVEIVIDERRLDVGLSGVGAGAVETGSGETRLATGSPDHRRCVDFLLDEAAALDENRLEDWLDLLHPEIDYRVPIRITRERAMGPGFSSESYHLFENHDSLTTRVERLATDYAWAEDPPSRTRRFLSNFRVYALDGSGDLRVRSNLLLYRERLVDAEPQLLSGAREDDLRELDGELRLVRRLVLLDHGLLATPNLGIFL